MARRSGLVTYPVSAMPWATDEDGAPIVGQVATGLVQITLEAYPLPADATHPEPRHVFEVEPGRGVDRLPGRPASIETIGVPWDVATFAASRREFAARWLDARWEAKDPETGARIIARGREVEVPDGVTPVEVNITAHRWAGDGDG